LNKKTIWEDANLATMADDGSDYGIVENGAVVVDDGIIAWIGPRSELPKTMATGAVRHSFAGPWVTPGLVDCHTHFVYGGDRAAEFELRLKGASYEEVARAGGGIVSTVKATRAASEAELVTLATERLKPLLAEGVTTVEVKSGYGLDVETELRMLRAARALGEALPVSVSATFLGAHALPPEYEGRPDAYIDEVCCEALRAAHDAGLVDAVDAFCEGIGFDVAQTRRVFDLARSLSLPVKLHAEQLSDLGGAAMAAGYGALSADHLEYLGSDGIAAMAEAGTVAVLLPGAYYFLRETKLPPIEALRNAGVPIAIATDANPGSSPVGSAVLMLNMACTLFRMTPSEALAGMTRVGAQALGLAHDRGTLEVGKRADLAVWNIASPGELAYRIGHQPCVQVIRNGTVSGFSRLSA
jgi:imidazolonepropionase